MRVKHEESRGDDHVAEGVPITIALTMGPDQLGEFFQLLQQGVVVEARVGCTLDRLLSRQWGISPDYVASRITTIFLNGRAIDDVTTALVGENAVIALSGAMPGLVGATMRRGGYYAAMRQGITYRETSAPVSEREATVRVKLFNLLLPELGPGFLLRGIILAAGELADFLGGKPASFWRGCASALLNGVAIDPGRPLEWESIAAAETIRLTAAFKDRP